MPDWTIAAFVAVLAWTPAAAPPAPVPPPSALPMFLAKERAVTNWRSEAAAHLDLPAGAETVLAAGGDPGQVTRCVRLNNYWCIKRAGWSGEIASDREGHVAFASAAEGADVAALLLRRYYIDYKRHSAYAIVSHWAPATCGVTTVLARAPRAAAPRLRTVRQPANRPDALSTHGVGNTLRARFLAARRYGRRGGGIRVSRVPDRLILRSVPAAPTIAVGLGEHDTTLPSLLTPKDLNALAAGPAAAFAPGAPLPPALPLRLCTGDEPRVRAYAIKASAGIAPTIQADLNLFLPDGTPTANLARLMHNMSAVEVGPLGASQALIDDAVARATASVAKTAAAAKPQP